MNIREVRRREKGLEWNVWVQENRVRVDPAICFLIESITDWFGTENARYKLTIATPVANQAAFPFLVTGVTGYRQV